MEIYHKIALVKFAIRIREFFQMSKEKRKERDPISTIIRSLVQTLKTLRRHCFDAVTTSIR